MKAGEGETSLAAGIDEKDVMVKVLSARVAGIRPNRIIIIDEERMRVSQVGCSSTESMPNSRHVATLPHSSPSARHVTVVC
jgi:hypothetical protein